MAVVNTVLDVRVDLIDHTAEMRNRIPVDARAFVDKRKVTESASMFI
jgi:hypothetical protein